MSSPAPTWPSVVLPLLGIALPAGFVATHADMLQAYLGLAVVLVPTALATVGTVLLLRRLANGRRVPGVAALIVGALPWAGSVARLEYSRSRLLEATRSGGFAYPELMARGVGESAQFWLLGVLGAAGLFTAWSAGAALAPTAPERRDARMAFCGLTAWLALLGAGLAIDLEVSSALLRPGLVPPEAAQLARAGEIHTVVWGTWIAGTVAAALLLVVVARRATSTPGVWRRAVASALVSLAIVASGPVALSAILTPLDEATRASTGRWQVDADFEPATIPGRDEEWRIDGRAFWSGIAGPSTLVVGRSWVAIADRDGEPVGQPRRGPAAAERFREILARDGRQERRAVIVEDRNLVSSPCVAVALDARLRAGELRVLLAAAGQAGVRSLLLIGRTPDSATARQQAGLQRALPLVAPFTVRRASVPVVLATAFDDAPRLEAGLRELQSEVPPQRRMALLRIGIRDGDTTDSLLHRIGLADSPQPDRQTVALLDAR